MAASKIRRGAHGLPIRDSSAAENQFAYEVPAPRMDWAQKALDDAQEAYKKANPNASMSALIWTVEQRG